MNARTIQLAVVLAIAAGAALPRHAVAQIPNPSTAALAMAENFTAAARGYSAVAWNPAGLGMADNPGFSFTFGTIAAIAGLGPLTVMELADYAGQEVPFETRREWLDRIKRASGETGRAGSHVTGLALQAGPVAFQVGTTLAISANLAPGIAELIMFGNADQDGTPREIDLSRSRLDVTAYTTGAASIGLPIAETAAGRLALGVTGKYTMGHVLVRGIESTGMASADPLELRLEFPIIHTHFGNDEDEEFEIRGGTGFGLDVGIGYETPELTLAATIRNLFNNFEWDPQTLRFRDGSLLFDSERQDSDLEERYFSEAPPALARVVNDLRFAPVLAAGARYLVQDGLLVTGDVRFATSDSEMDPVPRLHIGGGAEYRPISFIPLRAGVALISLGEGDSGWQVGGGIGINLPVLDLMVSAMRRSTTSSLDTVFQLTILGRKG